MLAALKALAEPRRVEIVRLLRRRAMSAGEIAARFDVTRPAVSQHLSVLRSAGLVTERRDGTRRIYRLRPERLREVRDYLDRLWSDGLERLGRAASESARRERKRGRP